MISAQIGVNDAENVSSVVHIRCTCTQFIKRRKSYMESNRIGLPICHQNIATSRRILRSGNQNDVSMYKSKTVKKRTKQIQSNRIELKSPLNWHVACLVMLATFTKGDENKTYSSTMKSVETTMHIINVTYVVYK